MAKKTRVTYIPFANAAVTNDVEAFGSRAAGSADYTKNVAVIQAGPAWDTGFKPALLAGTRAPFVEDHNAVEFVTGYMLGYLFEEGIAEYDSVTTYFIGSIVKRPGTYELYASKVDDNTGNALPSQTDDTNWKYLTGTMIPAGNTASRPAAPAEGTVYLNTQVHSLQRFSGSWSDIDLVPDASITVDKIASSLAGSGLTGGAGAALSVVVDNSTIEINTNTLRVKDLGITRAKLNLPSLIIDWTYAGTIVDPGGSSLPYTWNPLPCTASRDRFMSFASNSFTVPVTGLYAVGGRAEFDRDGTSGPSSGYSMALAGSRGVGLVSAGGSAGPNVFLYPEGAVVFLQAGEVYHFTLTVSAMGGGNPNYYRTAGTLELSLVQ